MGRATRQVILFLTIIQFFEYILTEQKPLKKNYLFDGLIKYNHVLFKVGLTGKPVALDVVPDDVNIIIKKTGGAHWKKSKLKKKKYSHY